MARFNGSDKQIYHNDHLGNVRAITDTSGAIVAKVDYYPFGEELGLTGSPGRFTYNGNELDDEYGFDLYYYGARYMDPALGRFTTPDPIRDFVNPYSYVRNNPVNAIDPTGMASDDRQYDSITGYDFGTVNPFWWVSMKAIAEWRRATQSIAEIEWLNRMLDSKEETDENKVQNQADQIKEGANSNVSEPGDPDFIGPVDKENPLATDWGQLNVGVSLYGSGLEGSLIIMPDGKVYLTGYLTVGVSTPTTIEYKQVSFLQEDEAPQGSALPSEGDQIQDFFNKPQWGINIGGGIGLGPAIDFTVGTPNNLFRHEPVSVGIGVIVGATLNLYGNSWIPTVYLGQYDWLKK